MRVTLGRSIMARPMTAFLAALFVIVALLASSASAKADPQAVNTSDLPKLNTAASLTDTTASTTTTPTSTSTTSTPTSNKSKGKGKGKGGKHHGQGNINNTPTSSSSTSTTLPPTTTLGQTTPDSVSHFSLTGAPSIAGVGVPQMHIPNTADAPFMQKSNLPEGTVFICVGAALGFLGASVLAWRGMVAWSLHRSVKRAALANNTGEAKPMLRPANAVGRRRLRGGGGTASTVGPMSTYSTVGQTGSMLSIDQLGSVGPGSAGLGKPGSRGNLTSTAGAAARSSLFFSPTAGAGMNPHHGPSGSTGVASAMMSPANRSSGYLPAGYYAAGSSSLAGGASSTHLGGGGNYAPLSTAGSLSRFSGVGSRNVSGPSPPSSPGLPPSRGGESAYGFGSGTGAGSSALYDGSNGSNLNLGAAPQGRAPSAYLEDLFENHGNGPRERF